MKERRKAPLLDLLEDRKELVDLISDLIRTKTFKHYKLDQQQMHQYTCLPTAIALSLCAKMSSTSSIADSAD